MEKIDIKSLTLPKLEKLVQEMGLPKYRAGQIFRWLHQKQVLSFAEMSDLSGELREKLAGKCYINPVSIKKKLVSALDGTVTYLPLRWDAVWDVNFVPQPWAGKSGI